MTVWSIDPADTTLYAPSTSPFMINYRVADLAALLQALRDEGCQVLDKLEDGEYGSPAGSSTLKATRSSCGSRRRASKFLMQAGARRSRAARPIMDSSSLSR